MHLKCKQPTCGEFDGNFAFSKKFYKEMSSILGKQVVREAPLDDDLRKCTDLMVLQVGHARIACRVRKHSYIKYSNEFTIRTRTTNGQNKTEYNKLFEDKTSLQYYIYAFANKAETGLALYSVIDWPAFIQIHNNYVASGSLCEGTHYGDRTNSDGSAFRYFNLHEFGEAIVEIGADYEIKEKLLFAR